jgi:hypothetical protein
MVANKTQPNKFEFEVVGEGYDWWPYKEVVYWANDKVNKGAFLTIDDAYKYILGNDTSVIRRVYTDFPYTILEYKA